MQKETAEAQKTQRGNGFIIVLKVHRYRPNLGQTSSSFSTLSVPHGHFARFDADPNTALAEVNVRESCFHPGGKVLNFISIIGLTIKQAVTQDSGPIHPQQGIITAFAGKIEGRLQHFNDASRMVPYYQPHSFKFVTKLDPAAANDKANQRYIDKNNLYIGPFSDQDGATDTAGNAKFDANAQHALRFTHIDTPDGVSIEFHVTDDAFGQLPKCDLITSASLGEFPLVKHRIEDRDGKPYDLDADIAGNRRRCGSSCA